MSKIPTPEETTLIDTARTNASAMVNSDRKSLRTNPPKNINELVKSEHS